MSDTAGQSHHKVLLPLEVILYILEISAWSYSTSHARNICLISHAAYKHCWSSLYRIIALRNAEELKIFSEYIYQPQLYSQEDSTSAIQKLKKKQDAIRCLYLNNNKDTTRLKEISDGERPDMWMMSILLAAKKLDLIHVEEYWSISYPWEAPEEKPLLAYPLMLFSSFPTAFQSAFAAVPESKWAQRLLSNRAAPDSQLIEEIISFQSDVKGTSDMVAQPFEVTLSALAMSTSHLMPSDQPASSLQKLPHNSGAFKMVTHLHLYFAKMDTLLVQTLLELPQMTHLRLTRPFSENLSEAAMQLLGLDDEHASMSLSCLIIEAGIYMDERTSTALRHMQSTLSGRKRLHFIDNIVSQQEPSQGPFFDIEESELQSNNSTSHVVNWVTSSEERGFTQFKQRARGDEGVWLV